MSNKNSKKISLFTAVLTNLNVMIGTGIFINTSPLITYAGYLSPLSYLVVGLIMLPLILTINKLMIKHPGGNFYTFGKEGISTNWGFVSSWSYFIGKLASCSLMIHFFSLLIQNLFPILDSYRTVYLDIFVIILLTFLNCLNTKVGSVIQLLLFIIKLSPILFIITAGIWVKDFSYCANFSKFNYNLLPTIPLVIYAFTGFEASCSLSSCIKNPEKNGPKAIIISFSLVVMLTILYQLWSYLAGGENLANLKDLTDFFGILATKYSSNITLQKNMSFFMQLAAAISALGAAYGVFYSNNRNLYNLAQEGHIYFSRYFMHYNSHHIPWLAVLAQAFVCIIYILSTSGNNIILQQIGAIGCTISYLISCRSLLKHGIKRNFIALIGYLCSLLLLFLSLLSVWKTNFIGISIFGVIVLLGLIMKKTA